MQKRLLRSIMAAQGDNQNTLASHLNITASTFSLKINEKNGTEFSQGEMKDIRKRYNLDSNTFVAVFFED